MSNIKQPKASSPMANVKLYYDGWLALPAPVRRRLALKNGDKLALEVIEGGIVLRPDADTMFVLEEARSEDKPKEETVVEKEAAVSRKTLPNAARARSSKTVIRSSNRKRPSHDKSTTSSLSILPKGLQARGRRKAEA